MALMSGHEGNKEKRKNSEKRKEKSRDAARSRRNKETEIFCQLASQLPVTFSQLDKASLMRLTISYLKIRQLLNPMTEIQKSLLSSPSKWDSAFLKALEGFLLVLSEEGDFVFLSENVHHYLGLTQIDLLGNNVYDFSHPCDHEEIKQILSFKSNENSKLPIPRAFFFRMKCTLTNKGRNVNVRSASYKVIHCSGYIINNSPLVKVEKESSEDVIPSTSFFIALGEPIPHPSNIEVPLDKQTFLSRHSLDMKFTYVDERIQELLEYKPEELLGKSVYQYHHALDTRLVKKNYKILFSKGQCETGPYRFLAKHGGFVWILTQGTVIFEGNSSKPQCVVCVNYVLSGIENSGEVVSEEQVSKQQETLPEAPPLKTSTDKLFCVRTEDMTKGFLMFSDENTGLTECQDEPEDLTHLAPKVADLCIPLECSPYSSDIFGDVLIVGDNKFLPEENLASEESSSLSGRSSPLNCDPFLKCKEASLCSPFSTDNESSSLSKDENLVERAPFIPMSNGDDCPLLSPPDTVMWGPQEYPRRRSLSHSPSRPVIDLEESSSSSGLSPTSSRSSLSPVLQSSNFKQYSRSRRDRSTLQVDRKHANIRALTSRSLSPTLTDHGGGTKRVALTVHKRMTNGGKVIVLENMAKPRVIANKSKSAYVSSSGEQLTLLEHVSKPWVVASKCKSLSFGGKGKQLTVPKVCVTLANGLPVSEEPKEQIIVPKDVCFKRTGDTDQTPVINEKKMRLENGQEISEGHITHASVLLNLLVNGEDASHGYMCVNTKTDSKSSPHSPQMSQCGGQPFLHTSLSALLDPEGSAIPSLADITHHDAEVNAPIQSASLLHGEELLHALDQTVKDVASLV
ncbi:hypoxia-inducible factor 1-alpha-like isoform X2 [Limulus polyphemus]|uniref:Hypoxia-inducible factor 1-alpha-like isoform X2 n=1 Tax=Limulus polyphemus TaxID=6850 RepID=A0ABM1BQZ6_LIMPO|nr:hypoxia-inducible factor 1-alpha-like isoform X2 [Limulus polyphemus]